MEAGSGVTNASGLAVNFVLQFSLQKMYVWPWNSYRYGESSVTDMPQTRSVSGVAVASVGAAGSGCCD